MKILSLLEEGKITADEAAKLIEAMKRNDEAEGFFKFETPTQEQVEEKFKHIAKNVDSFAREFGGHVEKTYRKMEPKLKKASQAVLEKTATIFDEISKSLNESLENARKSSACCDGGDKDCCGDESREN